MNRFALCGMIGGRQAIYPLRRGLNRVRRVPGHEIRGLTQGAMERLAAAPWPGNVRQLRNEVERLVLSHRRGQTIDSAKVEVGGWGEEVSNVGPLDLKGQVAELETRLVAEALRRSGGNQSAAARALGLSRNGLALKMRRLGIEPAESASGDTGPGNS